MRPRAPFERGASAVEYALLIAGIALVIVVVIVVLGGKLSTIFDDTCDKIADGTQTASCNP